MQVIAVLVMMLSPVESVPEGLLDLAARNGLRRVAVIKLDGLVANAAAKGASELAKKKGLEVVVAEVYPSGTSDFSDILNKVKAASPDVLMAASVRIEDLVAINRPMREVDLNVSMFSSVPYSLLPNYYNQVGKDAEFVYSGSFWESDLAYLGNGEFVTAYEKEFNRTPAVQSAASYAGCRLHVEVIGATGTLESDKLRAALLGLRTKTVLGDFAVDDRGFQIAHKAVTIQWQNGRNSSFGQMKWLPQRRHSQRPGGPSDASPPNLYARLAARTVGPFDRSRTKIRFDMVSS